MMSSEARDDYLHEMAAKVIRDLRLALEQSRARNRVLAAQIAVLEKRLAFRVLRGTGLAAGEDGPLMPGGGDRE